MMNEPTIIINGHTLTPGQAMTVRVAIESFAMSLRETANPLGNDLHGKRMTDGYQKSIDEIRRAMGLLKPHA